MSLHKFEGRYRHIIVGSRIMISDDIYQQGQGRLEKVLIKFIPFTLTFD